MKKLTLERTHQGNDCTLGRIVELGLFSIERPWLDNQSNISCIPDGEYKVRWSKSPRLKKYTYEILNVPNRAGIRIHAGNRASDSLGCPLLGMRAGYIGKDRAVLASREAVARFERAMNKETFTLVIKSV